LPQKEQLSDERNLLGTYLSGHPLDALLLVKDTRITPISALDSSQLGQKVVLAGIIKESRTIVTKNGDKMVFASLEDLSGSMDLTIFPRTLEAVKERLEDTNALLMVTGRADQRSDKLQLVVDDLDYYDIPKARNGANGGVKRQAKSIDIVIPLNGDDTSSISVVERVYSLLARSRGDIPFHLSLSTPQGQVKLEFAQTFVQYNQALEQEVIRLVGREHFSVEWT
jgi:DNA polymerase-3 subunit alpha